MVLKSSTVLSCLLPARFGFGSNSRPDSPLRPSNSEKHLIVPNEHPQFDPFRGNTIHFASPIGPDDRPDLSLSNVPDSLTHTDIGESPKLVRRPSSPHVRSKRSSFNTFFAFSSKRRPPVIHLPYIQPDARSVPGKWLAANAQTDVHLITPSAIPSPLRTEEEEFYYSYYVAPAFHSHPASPTQDQSHADVRQQDTIGNPESDPQPSRIDSRRPPRAQMHPYAYSTPLCSRPQSRTPSLRHATSQTFHHSPHSRSEVSPVPAYNRGPSSHLGHQVSRSQPHLSEPHLKTSMSTPNLTTPASPARTRSYLRKKMPTKSKSERWLSAETWWDALLSPSPRFKVKQAPRSQMAPARVNREPASVPTQGEPSRVLRASPPPMTRLRAVSATSNPRPTVSTLSRSRSTTDLVQPSTSAVPLASYEPVIETLPDEPMPNPVSGPSTRLPLPEPPLSLEQVLDEGKAFEEQRAEWKRQASKSIGNKHTRSFSRARSKSFGEKHFQGQGTSETGKVHFNLEFLAARSLLGSQSAMPTVHVTKPSSASLHTKAYSHSHSHSAYSSSHTSNSHAYSHSHSHSLSASNSSKSSRNPRGHSRSGSWSRTALLKAGALCGITQDDVSPVSDGRVPPSSRADVQGTVRTGRVDGGSLSPDVAMDGVGIAISSTPPCEGFVEHSWSGSRHQTDRWSSRHTQQSSEYAGPHPSAIDSNLPQLDVASNVSLRHRLPPRPAIYLPISPISHPYRAALGDDKADDKPNVEDASKQTENDQPETTCYSHLSLTQADFEQYGVGEALVLASIPRSGEPERSNVDVTSDPSFIESPLSEVQSPSRDTMAPLEESDMASVRMKSPPSVTSSTIQMVMSAFNNPDDLDEFQDLFYKPQPLGQQDASMTISQVPMDVRSSASNSPLAHLVRKLSEEVNSLRDPSRTPSDTICLQRSESHGSPNESTKFVFTDLTRPSSSPTPDSPSQVQVSIQGDKESTTQPVLVIPEDVNSSYTLSVLENLSPECENDTFGFPIKRGHLEVSTVPSLVQTPPRMSTHLSIQESEDDDDGGSGGGAFLRATKRYGMCDGMMAVRASCVSMSDVSQMSGLLDFPLPPTAMPGGVSEALSWAYFGSGESGATRDEDRDGPEEDAERRSSEGGSDGGVSGDVGEILHALRSRSRSGSVASHRTTFGGSDDMEFITQLHQAR